MAPSGGGAGGGREQTSAQGSKLCLFADQHVLLGLRFQELSWDHTSPEEEESVLWLEFDGSNEGTPVNKLLKIYSKQVVGWPALGVGPGEARLKGSQPMGDSRLARR